FEGDERRLVIDLPLEDLPIELDRANDVVEALFVELRDPILEAGRLVWIRAHLAFAREDPEELVPVLRLLVEDVGAVERLEIVRIELEDVGVRLDRLLDGAELAFVDRTDLVEDALLLVGVTDEIGLPLVDLEEVPPAREPEVTLD